MKKVIITGATSGIGKAFTLAYKDQFEIIAIGRSEEKLKELGTTYLVCDLSNEEQVINTANTLSKDHPDINVIINNAGVGVPTDLSQITSEEINSMFDTNVKGLILFTKPILEQMKKNNAGHVINISSTAGLESNPIAPVYCATKFALEAYTNGLREQVRENNIKVTAIRPDKVDSNYWGSRDVPRNTFLSPKEVADAINYVTTLPDGANIKDLTIESVR